MLIITAVTVPAILWLNAFVIAFNYIYFFYVTHPFFNFSMCLFLGSFVDLSIWFSELHSIRDIKRPGKPATVWCHSKSRNVGSTNIKNNQGWFVEKLLDCNMLSFADHFSIWRPRQCLKGQQNSLIMYRKTSNYIEDVIIIWLVFGWLYLLYFLRYSVIFTIRPEFGPALHHNDI